MTEPYAGQAAEKAARAKARWIANGGHASKLAATCARLRVAILGAIGLLDTEQPEAAMNLLKSAIKPRPRNAQKKASTNPTE